MRAVDVLDEGCGLVFDLVEQADLDIDLLDALLDQAVEVCHGVTDFLVRLFDASSELLYRGQFVAGQFVSHKNLRFQFDLRAVTRTVT